MAVHTPFAHPYTSEFFRVGEKFIGPNETNSATPGTYYFARKFQLVGGQYTIKYFVDDAATMWVGKTFAASAMVASFTVTDGEASLDLYLPPGLQRIDMIVQNFSGAAGFIFSLWKDGNPIYATSTPTYWVCDTAPIPDEAVPMPGDPRRLLPVFSLLPNWKDGIIERIMFLSDVLASETGAEQRRLLRTQPRRQFEPSFLRKGPNRAWLDAFFVGVGRDELLMPLWHEAITMVDGIDRDADTVTVIGGGMSEREYFSGDLVFVNNGDPNVFDVLLIGDVSDQGFQWATPPERDWPAGTRIYPLRQARVTENTSMDNVTDDVGTVSLRFQLTKSYALPGDWTVLPDGRALFPFKINRATAITGTFDRLVNELDNETGTPAITDISENTAVNISLALNLIGREHIYEYRRFLMSAGGRTRSFFTPSYTNDLEPLADEIAALPLLIARPMGAGRFFRTAQSARSHIAITLVGHSEPTIFRKIIAIEKQFVNQFGLDVNYEANFDYDSYMLDSALPQIKKKDIERISFASEARFDQDNFEIRHISNTSKVATTSCLLRMLGNRRDLLRAPPVFPPAPPPLPSLPPSPTPPLPGASVRGQTLYLYRGLTSGGSGGDPFRPVSVVQFMDSWVPQDGYRYSTCSKDVTAGIEATCSPDLIKAVGNDWAVIKATNPVEMVYDFFADGFGWAGEGAGVDIDWFGGAYMPYGTYIKTVTIPSPTTGLNIKLTYALKRDYFWAGNNTMFWQYAVKIEYI